MTPRRLVPPTALAPATALHFALAFAIPLATWIATAVAPGALGGSVFFYASFASLIAIVGIVGFPLTAVAITGNLLSVVYLLLEPRGSWAIAGFADGFRAVFAWAFLLYAARVMDRFRQERARLQEREAALLASEGRYRALLDEASDAIIVADPAGRVQMANGRALRLLDLDLATLVGKHLEDFVLPPEGDTVLPPRETLSESDGSPIERRMRRSSGVEFIGELTAHAFLDGTTQVIIRDVTSRLSADAAARAERDLLDGIIDTSPSGIIAIDIQTGKVVFANQRISEALGIPRRDLYAVPLNERPWRTTHFDGRDFAAYELPTYRVATSGSPIVGLPMRIVTGSGVEILTSVNAALLRDEKGAPRIVVQTIEDVTDRVRTQRALEASQHKLEAITRGFPGAVYQFEISADGAMSIPFISDGVRELLGLEPSEVTASFQHVWELVLPEHRESLLRSIQDATEPPDAQPWSHDFRIRDTSGRIKWLRGTSYPERSDGPGRLRWNGIFLDVTKLKEMELHLLQSQKMEGIGRLAGGIAHDFNNILTAIRGNVDLLLEELPGDDERSIEVREIRDAADRAGTLTRQLLAFSRKQILQPRELDLNFLVRDVEKMLRRVIGEDVALLTVPAESLGLVRADPGQLEQALLNLAVNARDAMPEGGLLTIDTRNARLDVAAAATLGLPPGEYVCLVVRDTGHGMSAEVKARIFEPFFTTKPPGKGTGLGLAMVYGIVQQSGGAIAVESEPGRGATFRLYLPRIVIRERASPSFVPVVPASPRQVEGAKLLLVEDDAAVRQLTRRLLERDGYVVRMAHDAYEALGIVSDDVGNIDLVVSDVIMPGMGGRELVAELRRRRPDLRVLFISGYLDIDSNKLGLDRRTRLLLKPFTQEGLSRELHDLLDERNTAGAPTAPSEPTTAL